MNIQTMNILTFIIIFLLLNIVQSKAPPALDGSGEIFIKDALLFELKARPYLASQITILHQPLSLTSLDKLMTDHSEMAIFLNETCEMIAQHYTVSQGARVTRQTLNRHRYVVLDKEKHSQYRSEQMCIRNQMRLPEPTTDREIRELATFLKKNSITATFIGTTYDIRSRRNYFTTKGIPFSDEIFKDTRISSGRNNNVIPKLYYQSDDYTARLTVLAEGEIKIYHGPQTQGIDSKLIETLHHKGNGEELQYKHMRRESVVCEIPPGDSETKNSGNEYFRQKNTITLCKTANKVIADSAQRTKTMLTNTTQMYGLEWDNSRTKRIVGLLAKVVPSLFSPSILLDIFNQYKTDKRLDQHDQAISNNNERIIEQAKEMDKLSIHTEEIEREQQALKTSLRQTRDRVRQLEQLREIDQTLITALALNQNLESGIINAINELKEFLSQVQENKIPHKMLRPIAEYLEGKGLPTQALSLGKDRPILLDRKVRNRTIHLYATFIEGQNKWDLFEITPLPIQSKGKQYKRRIPYTHVLVDRQQKQFSILNEEETKHCQNNVCDKGNIRKQVINDQCGIISLVGEPTNKDCPKIEETSEAFFKNTEHGIVYVVPKKLQARASCINERDLAGIDKEITLVNTGLIKLPPGCDLVVNRPSITMKGPLPQIFRTYNGLVMKLVNDTTKLISEKKNSTLSTLEEKTRGKLSEIVKEKVKKIMITLTIVCVIIGIIILMIFISQGSSIFLVYRRISRVKNRALDIKKRVLDDINSLSQTTSALRNRITGHADPYLHLGQEARKVTFDNTYQSTEGAHAEISGYTTPANHIIVMPPTNSAPTQSNWSAAQQTV